MPRLKDGLHCSPWNNLVLKRHTCGYVQRLGVRISGSLKLISA